ncbi:glycosyltransferase family 2 protein [Microbulbifer taiwanensis]|uniref:glycosyltransferase family 2 protein n=1 Tax=Microbulbifer taiwanensis TaxID=986746 RepID=UPI00361A8828
MKLGIAAIFKNEFDYILEWIAYHQLIGVDKFFIADNVSNDGSSQLLEALDSLGIINRVYFPRVEDAGPQVPAYNKILQEYGAEVDLLAFIDADEFIVTTNDRPLKENLQKFYRMEDAGALALNWRNFGSSREVFKGAEPVIKRFTLCSRKDHNFNRHIKSILKPHMTERMNIHECVLKLGRYYSSDLKPAVFENGEPCGPKTAGVVYEAVRVNHYVVKSKQEHILNKDKKGSGAGSATRRKGQAYFRAHDLNDELDNSLMRFVPGVKRCVEEFKELLVRESPYLSFGSANIAIRGYYFRLGGK